jgi:hypothetical protein
MVSLSNFMELSPSWEGVSCAANKKVSNILWNLKVYYSAHKSHPLVPNLNQINPIDISQFYLRPILMLSTYFRLGCPCSLIPYDLPINILHAFLFEVNLPVKENNENCVMCSHRHPHDKRTLHSKKKQYILFNFVYYYYYFSRQFCKNSDLIPVHTLHYF